MLFGVPVFASAMESLVEVLTSTDDTPELQEDNPSGDAFLARTKLSAVPLPLIPTVEELEGFRARLYEGDPPPELVQKEDYLAFELVWQGKLRMEDVQEVFRRC